MVSRDGLHGLPAVSFARMNWYTSQLDLKKNPMVVYIYAFTTTAMRWSWWVLWWARINSRYQIHICGRNSWLHQFWTRKENLDKYTGRYNKDEGDSNHDRARKLFVGKHFLQRKSWKEMDLGWAEWTNNKGKYMFISSTKHNHRKSRGNMLVGTEHLECLSHWQ